MWVPGVQSFRTTIPHGVRCGAGGVSRCTTAANVAVQLATGLARVAFDVGAMLRPRPLELLQIAAQRILQDRNIQLFAANSSNLRQETHSAPTRRHTLVSL